MGWLWYKADFYNNRGKVDRKKEMDAQYNGDGFKVLKSSLIGSIYYAAIQVPDGDVVAAICITSEDSSEYYNFGYKGMDESMGPYFHDCPVGIIKLLSPTTNKYALGWRQGCIDRAESKKLLSKLKIGSIIKCLGETWTLSYVNNKKYWLNNKYRYLKPSVILTEGYEVVESFE